MTTSVAIIGSGNIATDLMLKIKRLSPGLNVAAMAGIDPESDGLARARRMGVATTHHGVSGLLDLPAFADVRVVFDATSAGAHPGNYVAVRPSGAVLVDMTPAAIGPYVVPAVNIDSHAGADNVNMVTCGGQATVPIVSAISRVTPVVYGEIVASIASRSAGPGTRANIDEFTETTSRAIEEVGGAAYGKAVIVLNPADPPPVMRNTVFCLVREAEEHAIRESVERRVEEVRTYVPGYRLKHDVQFDNVQHDYVPVLGTSFTGSRVSVFLEVTGAGHYLPDYAGNLDIMTSAALRTGELMAIRQSRGAHR